MRQIYNFDGQEPPRLTGGQLQAELERRRLRRQVIILGIASVFCALAFLLFAVFIVRDFRILAAFSLGTFGLTVVESGIVGVLFWKKRRWLMKYL